ncbi:MAG TPA: septum formation inhibitor Maf [Thermoanaerobaculia bacterium]
MTALLLPLLLLLTTTPSAGAALPAGVIPAARPADPEAFGRYWYAGKAELTRYALEQARYGEIHQGESVLVFVTEPFWPDKQVKLERGDPARAATVLKLNFTRKFFTGIYPYSLMTSTFTQISGTAPHTLKVTTSAQEWCGHTFTQLNYRERERAWRGLLRSYFESEGDREFTIPDAWLEDEIWNRIRIAPASLPVGSIRVVPGLQFARMGHRFSAAEPAEASLSDAAGGERVYTLRYPEFGRTLTIRFQSVAPYKITSWEETQPGRGASPPLTTKAVRTHELYIDYWRHNGVDDAPYRKQLGLTEW